LNLGRLAATQSHSSHGVLQSQVER
jgi:hypothetical protein